MPVRDGQRIEPLSFLLARTVPAIKARAFKLRLKRDPGASRMTRQAAGKAGYAAAEKRRAGEPVRLYETGEA